MASWVVRRPYSATGLAVKFSTNMDAGTRNSLTMYITQLKESVVGIAVDVVIGVDRCIVVAQLKRMTSLEFILD